MRARVAARHRGCCVARRSTGIHVRFEKDAATGATHAHALPELDAYLTMEEVAPLEHGD